MLLLSQEVTTVYDNEGLGVVFSDNSYAFVNITVVVRKVEELCKNKIYITFFVE